MKAQELLVGFEAGYQNLTEEIVKRSLYAGEVESKMDAIAILESTKLPIFTIAFLPSKFQYRILKDRIDINLEVNY